MKRVAISIGDLNGIGAQLALSAHSQVSGMVKPLYVVDETMIRQAAKLLDMEIAEDFETVSPGAALFDIEPGVVSADSGRYSFFSFKKAIEMVKDGECDSLCTLPIHKKAWEKGGIAYRGHTEVLRDFFGKDAIMMLGRPGLYVALYTEHIPLSEVASMMDVERLRSFLLDFARETGARRVAVLGLNPHAGDDGVMGDEERIIAEAIAEANRERELFEGPIVPDIAFTPALRSRYEYYVAMYHDQGLAPLKALYFSESINVSLNLPILRSSVDHGTAFDIAYRGVKADMRSYLNAIAYLAGR